jgi:hypothetical protein
MSCSVIALFVFSLESPGAEDDHLQLDILPAIKQRENRNILMICFFLTKIPLIWESEFPNCIKSSSSLELVPIFSAVAMCLFSEEVWQQYCGLCGVIPVLNLMVQEA